MKKIATLCILAAALWSCSTLSQNVDSTSLLQAAGTATQALMISDADVAEMARAAVAELDAQNKIAPANDALTVRLNKIMGKHTTEDGLTLNYKVYKTTEVNAFACADGSIRVYEGLMKLMTDDEIRAVLGHEIGHVRNADTRNAMKNAYLGIAARTAIGATNTTIGALSRSQLGELATSLSQSQYSQKQEYAADDYALAFLVRNGYNKYSMYNALNKLLTLSAGATSDQVSALFSSHPDTQARATRAKQAADNVK